VGTLFAALRPEVGCQPPTAPRGAFLAVDVVRVVLDRGAGRTRGLPLQVEREVQKVRILSITHRHPFVIDKNGPRGGQVFGG
jgi:hypothetical protein